jgi:hypothetical protein
MNGLLYAIRAIYHAPNPYHNYVHAIDVLQATYSFLMDIGVVPPFSYLLEPEPRKPWQRPDEVSKSICGVGTRRAREVLRPQDVLAVLVAAMGHDVGHPGLSNAFMVSFSTSERVLTDDRKTQRHPYQRYTTINRYSRICTACSLSDYCGNTVSVSSFPQPPRHRRLASNHRDSARSCTRLSLLPI